jgi:diguanylate cyclase (GGDEF)-like protein/PAS domain S-box-containing protein
MSRRLARRLPVGPIVDVLLLLSACSMLVLAGLWMRDPGGATAGARPSLGVVCIGLAAALAVRGIVLAGDRARTRGDLDRARRRYQVLTANSADATMLVDGAGVVVEASTSYAEVIGDPNADPVGRQVFRRLHPEARDDARRAFEAVLARAGGRVDAEVPIVNDDGSERWLEVRVANLLDDPDVGLVLVNVHDITARRVAEEQLRHQAYHDPVTGAANRAMLADQVAVANRRHQQSGATSALLLLDLDDFSAVNERLGHDGGDMLLRQVHERLLAVVRAGDTVARLGGDQFAVLIAQAGEGPEEALAMATRIAGRLGDSYRINGESMLLGATIGIALAADSAVDHDALLRDAAVALSHAKASGRSGVALFEPSMREAAIDRLRLEADLVVALERDQFQLHFQPLVDLDSGVVRGLEALIRWFHPDVGLIPPDRFVPLAEQNGLIVPIGEWVLRRSCAAAAGWSSVLGADLEMSVNVSARQLASDTLVPTIRLALAESGVPPSSLVIEITESTLVTDPRLAAGRLSAVRDLGVRVAIDDFGTGYSSLSYLQQLPVDVLKIDRSFVNAITAGAPPPPIVRGLVDLAGTLGLATVAEGVEHQHQLDYLRTVGCRFGQGFLFSRPVAEADVVTMVTRPLIEAG